MSSQFVALPLDSSSSPAGPAGGDLSGTYPNPTVATIGGAAVTSAATASTVVKRDANGNAQFAALTMSHISASVDNVGMGSAPSASAGAPFIISRDNESSGTSLFVTNPTASANAFAGLQLTTDANNGGFLGAYTTASTPDPYISSFVVRPSGDTLHLSLMGGEQSSGNIRMYTGGAFDATGLAMTVNADKSTTSIGGVILATTASRPAAGSAYRGMLWVVQGGAGVTDTIEVCLKSAANTYSWVSIITGG